jgi:hypothetical protein
VYNGSDGYMLETSGALQALFEENIADFTALDSTLDATFATNWFAKITAASQVVQHSQIKDIKAQKTDEVLEKMELCRLKYIEVKFFATKSFPDSKSRQAEFGTDSYSKARTKHSNMITFMDEMHKACVKYQNELLAVGMSQTSIDEVALLRDALFKSNTRQESYSRATPVMTQERIDVLNACYTDTRTVIDAAMIVYYHDFARRNMFVYLPSSGDKNDSEIITQAITTEDPVLLFSIPFVEDRQFVIRNNGPADVNFYIADTSGEGVKKITVIANNFQKVTSIDLGDEGSNLYAILLAGSETTADVEVEIVTEI